MKSDCYIIVFWAKSEIFYSHQLNNTKIVLGIQVIEVKLRSVMAAYGVKHGTKLTYQQLSEMTGISKATLEAIGSRPDYNTTLAVLDVLCQHLECSISELLAYHRESL
jgi:putative transcriptional regulator